MHCNCNALRPVVISGVAAKRAGSPALVLAPTELGHLWIEDGLGVRLARAVLRFIAGHDEETVVWRRFFGFASPRGRYRDYRHGAGRIVKYS